MSNTSDLSVQSATDHQSSEQVTPEEDTAALEKEDDATEEEATAKEEECWCSFFDQAYTSMTLDEYQQDQLKEGPLFTSVLVLDKDEEQVCVDRATDDSILVSSFGMRNLASLQDALKIEERNRLYELFKKQKPSEKQKESTVSLVQSSMPKQTDSKRSIETETELSSVSTDASIHQDKVRYLMGIEADESEEDAYPQEEDLVRHMFAKESEDKFVFSQTTTTKSAQIYLRTHRIFDFFQFIIAHILSAAPENPINFILVLLNKMLLYRAGTGNPPLLYERKHIEQLFKLMDRLHSGFIEKDQYVSGMTTLGICDYNKDPELTKEGLVSEEVFVREAMEAEIALFNDLIKRKWTGGKPKVDDTFSSDTTPIRSYSSGFNLVPSDLLRSRKITTKLSEDIDEG